MRGQCLASHWLIRSRRLWLEGRRRLLLTGNLAAAAALPVFVVFMPIGPAQLVAAGRHMCPTSTNPLPWPLTWPTLPVRSPSSPALVAHYQSE